MFTWLPPRQIHPVALSDRADAVTHRRIISAGANPELAHRLTLFRHRLSQLGHQHATVQLYRAYATQQKLYAQGRTTPGQIVTDAQGWQSAHCAKYNGKPDAQAFEVAPIIDNEIYWQMDARTSRFWSDARDTGAMLQLVWGATINDPPRDFGHFQLPTFRATKN